MRKLIVFAISALFTVAVMAQSSYTPVTREAAGGQNAFGQMKYTSVSLSVTNGQIIALGEYPVILVDASAQASLTTTNTIANAAAGKVGMVYTIINVGASNGVLIADSAPVYNSGATLGATDASVYYVQATNVIVQTSTSNN